MGRALAKPIEPQTYLPQAQDPDFTIAVTNIVTASRPGVHTPSMPTYLGKYFDLS
jgi:hypothetical protein